MPDVPAGNQAATRHSGREVGITRRSALCTLWRRRRDAHLISDFADCAETHPGAGWPEQARRARGLIHAWPAAREQALPAIPDDIRRPLEPESRRAVAGCRRPSPSHRRAKTIRATITPSHSRECLHMRGAR
jgi:hypothetical protein